MLELTRLLETPIYKKNPDNPHLLLPCEFSLAKTTQEVINVNNLEIITTTFTRTIQLTREAFGQGRETITNEKLKSSAFEKLNNEKIKINLRVINNTIHQLNAHEDVACVK